MASPLQRETIEDADGVLHRLGETRGRLNWHRAGSSILREAALRECWSRRVDVELELDV